MMKKIISFVDKEFLVKKEYEIPKIEITPKEIGHVFAIQITKKDKKEDKKIISTEGWTLTEAAKFMESRIKDYIKYIKDSSNPKIEQQTNLLSNLQQQIKKAREFKQNILKESCETQKQLEESISQLEPHQSLLIPGGWRTSHLSNNNNTTDSNHTMLYEVMRQENGLLTWRIFNTGSGIRHHRKSPLNAKYDTVLELMDIPQSKMMEILNQLILVQTKLHQHSKDQILRIIYQDCIQKALDIGAKKIVHQNHFQSAQRGGFCNWKSLKDYLKFHLPKEVYQNLKKFIDFQVYESAKENLTHTKLPDQLSLEEKNEFKKELMKAVEKKFQSRYKISVLQMSASNF